MRFLCPQGVSATGSGDAWRLRHQLGGGTFTSLHVWRPQDQRAPILQVHTAGRPV